MAHSFFVKGAEVTLNDSEFCEAVGAVLFAAGLPSESISFYELALDRQPQNPELLYKINEAYQSVFEGVSSV